MSVDIVGVLVPIGICVVLPILIVWLVIRLKIHESNKRTEIVLAAIEKNGEVDVEEFLKKLNPPTKTLKEKMLGKLLASGIFSFVGLVILVSVLVEFLIGGINDKVFFVGLLLGGIIFAIGIAFFITYRVGKKMLSGEMEAETEVATDHQD